MDCGNYGHYDKPDELCPKCGIKLNARIVLHNVPKNCEEYITYPFMAIGESMHFECYLTHVMDIYWKRLNDKKTNAVNEQQLPF